MQTFLIAFKQSALQTKLISESIKGDVECLISHYSGCTDFTVIVTKGDEVVNRNTEEN